MATTSATARKLYFGFGSNLWRAQMVQRCPDSPFRGIARLRGYRWFINDRGYANIAPEVGRSSEPAEQEQKEKEEEEEVWGLVYALSPADEAQLDLNEGVPFAYEKEMLRIDFWAHEDLSVVNGTGNGNGNDHVGSTPATATVQNTPPVETEMLVYIDRRRVADAKPRAEYVHRMNMGIADALREGVPAAYVERVLRRFIPPEADEAVRALALKQAARFKYKSEEV